MKILFLISRWLFWITGGLLATTIIAVAAMGNNPNGIKLRMGAFIILIMTVMLITAPFYWLTKNISTEPKFTNKNKIIGGWAWLIIGIIVFIYIMPMIIEFLIKKI